MTIVRARVATPELAGGLAALLPHLSSQPPPDLERLSAMLGDANTWLLVAHDPAGEIVGTLTLVVVHLLTGIRALIEDVVVDDRARGRGVGAALVASALEHASTVGARTVDLTSRPSREAANRLYERAGFVRRETNVWRHDLVPGPAARPAGAA